MLKTKRLRANVNARTLKAEGFGNKLWSMNSSYKNQLIE